MFLIYYFNTLISDRFAAMMNEEPSDWDSMSDPATENQPSSLEVLEHKDKKDYNIDIKKSANDIEAVQRPKSAYQRTLESPNTTTQKSRISDGTRNQSLELSDNLRSPKDSLSKLEKKEHGTPLTNKVDIITHHEYVIKMCIIYKKHFI